jgi:hypothetical protein
MRVQAWQTEYLRLDPSRSAVLTPPHWSAMRVLGRLGARASTRTLDKGPHCSPLIRIRQQNDLSWRNSAA